MSLDAIVSARIHPSIGVARIGNSQEYFIGPEVPHPTAPPGGGYRDGDGRLKRQAARFRVYGYDAQGGVVAELTAENADVRWTVHVANKKAAWYDFLVALDLPEAATTSAPRRNAAVPASQRGKLVIDPGARSVTGRDQRSAAFDTGTFFDVPVSLGELRTDGDGRLIFLGGRGVSASPFPGNSLTTFANNGGWHDDVSDGPVTAAVKVDGREIPVDPGWVIVGPPNYAPDIVTVQTMYDVIYDAMVGRYLPRKPKPSFQEDLYPLFRQFVDSQWVNYGFFVQFGWQAPNEFTRPDFMVKLAAPGTQFQELRLQIAGMFRDPAYASPQPLQWPPIYGDAFGNFDASPRVGFAVTNTLYGYLQSWVSGNFVSDFDPTWQPPASLDAVALERQPSTLDRAALHFCMGGPFHPGCELTWPMRLISMYAAPFRLRHRPSSFPETDYGEFLTQATVTADDGPLAQSGPGDLTKWMAVPWQTDTASCRSGYPPGADRYIPTFWPSRVPNHVLTDDAYRIVVDPQKSTEDRVAAFNTRRNWLRSLNLRAPYIEQITKMVSTFGELGIVEKRPGVPNDPLFPPVMFVETGVPTPAAPLFAAKSAADTEEIHDFDTVSEEFSRARFGGPRGGRS